MQSALDRRTAILEILSDRRRETYSNLAFELGVSTKTIERDITILSVSAPIFTSKGNGGGVYVADGYRYGNRFLNDTQLALLEKLSINLNEEDTKTMNSILKTFTKPRKENNA